MRVRGWRQSEGDVSHGTFASLRRHSGKTGRFVNAIFRLNVAGAGTCFLFCWNLILRDISDVRWRPRRVASGAFGSILEHAWQGSVAEASWQPPFFWGPGFWKIWFIQLGVCLESRVHVLLTCLQIKKKKIKNRSRWSSEQWTRGPWTLTRCLTDAVGMTLTIFCRLVSKTHYCKLINWNLRFSLNSHTVPDYACINLDHIQHLWPFKRSLKVKCDGGFGLRIYDLLLVFNSDIWPNSAALRDMSFWYLNDLDIDLSRSLKVRCDSVIILPIYGFLLMFNSNIWPNSVPLQHMSLKSERPWIWPFKLTQGIWWCHWTLHKWFRIDIYSNHMSNSHRLALIAAQKVFSYLLSLGPNYENRKCTEWTLNDLELKKAKGTLYMLTYYPWVPNFTPFFPYDRSFSR